MRRQTKIKLVIYLILMVFFLLFATNLLFAGIMLNTMVVESNNDKMPVFSSGNLSIDEKHFSFTNPKTVKYFMLTDILHIGVGILSIGDILIFTATLLISFSIQYYSYSIFRLYLRSKNEKHRNN